MKVVKYPEGSRGLQLGENEVAMPLNSQIIKFAHDTDGQLRIWVVHSQFHTNTEPRYLYIARTDEELPEDRGVWNYAESILSMNALAWTGRGDMHLFFTSLPPLKTE